MAEYDYEYLPGYTDNSGNPQALRPCRKPAGPDESLRGRRFQLQVVRGTLGLSWNPDLLLHNAEVGKAAAEYGAAAEKTRSLRRQVRLDVSRAYREARKKEALLDAAKESHAAAKTWLRTSQDNWDLRIGDAFRLLRAYQGYYRTLRTEIESEYEFNVALARLSRELGDVDLYLRWIRNGQVTLENNP